MAPREFAALEAGTLLVCKRCPTKSDRGCLCRLNICDGGGWLIILEDADDLDNEGAPRDRFSSGARCPYGVFGPADAELIHIATQDEVVEYLL